MAHSGRVEDVPLSQARATQNTMAGGIRSPLIKGYGDIPVAARREDGEYLIFDGHHRTVAAINAGKSSLPMHVIDVKDYSPEFQGRKPAPYTGPSDDDLLKSLMGDSATDDTILVLATSELQGICDAVSQQASRLVAHCVLTRARPTRAAQGIRQLIATIGLQRSRVMADYLVVKAHAAATLKAFREAGVTHVGTVAEMVPDTALTDAARKTPQHQHPTTGKFITKAAATREWGRRGSGKFGIAPKTYIRIIAHRKALRAAKAFGEEEVNVQTAGDDRVCATCQAISTNGPYPIDEAMDLIPNHPRCRCVYVPVSVGSKSQRTT